MQFTTLALALTGAAAVSAQAVTSAITPTGSAPAGCTASADGTFEITVYQSGASNEKRDLTKRGACGTDGTLVITLEDGKLLDNKQRTGYIASNYQFQFDGPAQAGAIYTAGFSICPNSSLALGDTEVFYRCRSGSFYNLYNKNWAPQCEPVAIGVIPCGDDTSSSSSSSYSASTSAAATGTVSTASYTTIAPKISEITDGQPQAPTAEPVVSQYTDGQIQVPTTIAVVSQITDGQPQAPTAVASAPSASAPAATSSGPISPPIESSGANALAGSAAMFAGFFAVALL